MEKTAYNMFYKIYELKQYHPMINIHRLHPTRTSCDLLTPREVCCINHIVIDKETLVFSLLYHGYHRFHGIFSQSSGQRNWNMNIQIFTQMKLHRVGFIGIGISQ